MEKAPAYQSVSTLWYAWAGALLNVRKRDRSAAPLFCTEAAPAQILAWLLGPDDGLPGLGPVLDPVCRVRLRSFRLLF